MTCRFMARLGIAQIKQVIHAVHKEIATTDMERQTQESEHEIGKLLEDFVVAASPCYVRDLRYNIIYPI